MVLWTKRPVTDDSYQVSVHLAKGFQRRILKCEKLTDDVRQVMAKAYIATWQSELISGSSFHRVTLGTVCEKKVVRVVTVYSFKFY